MEVPGGIGWPEKLILGREGERCIMVMVKIGFANRKRCATTLEKDTKLSSSLINIES